MGQYYRAAILGRRYGFKGTIRPYNYGTGTKLMEHSYVGNMFVNAVLAEIMNQPQRVAWIGDYSDSQETFETSLYKDKIDFDYFDKIYGYVWDSRKRVLHPHAIPFRQPEDYERFYLINHSRKSYVDLGKCKERDDFGYIVSPLPLLTACGNGQGGGDYYSAYPDCDKCGLWAFDLLEFAGAHPRNYTEEVYEFVEKTIR